MNRYFFKLRNALKDFLSTGTWNDIEEKFYAVGLKWREDLEPGRGKPKYVERVLAELSVEEIVELAKQCVSRFEEDEIVVIQDALWWFESDGYSQLSKVTKNLLLDVLDTIRLHPTMEPGEFLLTFPQIRSHHNARLLNGLKYNNHSQLVTSNADHLAFIKLLGVHTDEDIRISYHTHKEILEEFDFSEWPAPRIFQFLEKLVHPEVRIGEQQLQAVNALNKILAHDGLLLKCTHFLSGYCVYTVELMYPKFEESPKYLIFSSIGPKPEIGFEDAVSANIKILKYANSCLIYDRPIDPNIGVLWSEMVDWWEKSAYYTKNDPHSNPHKSLGARLLASLDSEPEKQLLLAYFRVLKSIFLENLPALIPQVYVHYDPITIAELRARGDRLRFEKQRMDFLLLLPRNGRVILEIDGRQHYTENNRPSPSKYAVTVRSDRNL